jgi:hypothetical protein
MNIAPTNCRPGSAWDTWQNAGRTWRTENPDTVESNKIDAASQFANLEGWPEAGKNARHRAFLEGASCNE